MGSSDFLTSKDRESPLIKTFNAKFGNGFCINFPGELFYSDSDGKWHKTPDTKTEFFDMVSQSIKQDKNLFLDYPIVPLPVGIEI
ncbi:MAG: hypothetical protein LBQ93_05150 [Treponema sp.]|jgi:hypothetical protein|nr:hypothetical protein [Treponema sp.]